MKTVKIKHFCRLSIVFVALIALVLLLALWFLVTGIAENTTGFISVGAIPLISAAVGLGFFCNYGITITPKRVRVMYFNTFKNFRFEDITRMEIGFDNESIWGEIKAKNQKVYIFYLDEFELNTTSFLSRFLTVKVKLSQKYVDKLIEDLSLVDKVEIRNRFEDSM